MPSLCYRTLSVAIRSVANVLARLPIAVVVEIADGLLRYAIAVVIEVAD
jgi:hypothetical protein